jgi:hypothetical protein
MRGWRVRGEGQGGFEAQVREGPERGECQTFGLVLDALKRLGRTV